MLNTCSFQLRISEGEIKLLTNTTYDFTWRRTVVSLLYWIKLFTVRYVFIAKWEIWCNKICISLIQKVLLLFFFSICFYCSFHAISASFLIFLYGFARSSFIPWQWVMYFHINFFHFIMILIKVVKNCPHNQWCWKFSAKYVERAVNSSWW